jgi:hypothetical protein
MAPAPPSGDQPEFPSAILTVDLSIIILVTWSFRDDDISYCILQVAKTGSIHFQVYYRNLVCRYAPAHVCPCSRIGVPPILAQARIKRRCTRALDSIRDLVYGVVLPATDCGPTIAPGLRF